MGSKICHLAHILLTGRGEQMWRTNFIEEEKIVTEFGVILESGVWNEWQTFENKFSFDFEKIH